MKPNGLSRLKFEAFKNLLLSETVLEITQSSRLYAIFRNCGEMLWSTVIKMNNQSHL